MAIKEGDDVRCKCGQKVGEIVRVGETLLLVVNGVAISYFRGVCMRCKRPFYWDIGAIAVGKILEN
ncbi:MAG: hypothetical protein KBA03_03720 [Anaerolineaceae bacterium]|nr:hypothetical protein [Anaerolineaceae bacterium]